MMVFLPAQRLAVYADRRWCTWVYETTNETERWRRYGWLAIMRHSHRPNCPPAGDHAAQPPAELPPGRWRTGLALGCPHKEA